MQRELQADLLRDLKNNDTMREQAAIALGTGMDTDRKIKLLAESFEALLRRMESFETRFDQVTKNITLRTERTMTMISHVQTQINHISNDLNDKVVMLSAKINERKLSETRTEDLIERHNTVVKALEARLAQMHRMFAEQEAQIHGFSSALNEARAEIRRYKRND